MDPLLRQFMRSAIRSSQSAKPSDLLTTQSRICTQCRASFLRKPLTHRPFHSTPRRPENPADTPGFTSILDNPPRLIKTGKRNTFGLIILTLIPVTAFALGTWQVQRLSWKSEMIARYEDRLLRPPLPLPPQIDPSVIGEFDYRKVVARGRFRHDQEILIGPRLHDGENGYIVITPFERVDEEGKGSTILVNRGWITRDLKDQRKRMEAGSAQEALPQGPLIVQGLLREAPKGNRFTPANDPTNGNWYFPNVKEMAAFTGAVPVYVEETMQMELTEAYRRQEAGIPIGRAPEVNLRNNHAQYVFTWYALGLATSVMLWMIVKQAPRGASARVRRNAGW